MFKCSKCDSHKNKEDFPPNTKKVSGVDSHCKLCRSQARTKKMRKINPDFYSHREKFATDNASKRVCRICESSKSIELFGFNNLAKKIRQYECRDCAKAYAKQRYIEKNPQIKASQKAYYENNKEACNARARKTALKSFFGITPEQRDQMLLKCGSKCEICERDVSLFSKGLSVDHNHVTGKVRGMLCFSCNTSIGKMNCDVTIERLVNAIEYIKRTELDL